MERLPKIVKARRQALGLTEAVLDKLIEEALVDAYGDEQRMSFYSLIQGNLAVPFKTEILGMQVRVERVALIGEDEVVAICRRGREEQTIPILDLPLPAPLPKGAEWIEAYRRFLGEG